MHCLYEDDPRGQPGVRRAPRLIDLVLGLDRRGKLDEPVPAGLSLPGQHGQTREVVLLTDAWLRPRQAPDVPLLSSEKMVKSLRDRAVCPRGGQLELLSPQPGSA